MKLVTQLKKKSNVFSTSGLIPLGRHGGHVREDNVEELPKELKEKYKITNRKLGEGAFAKVYYGVCKESKDSVAIKILDKTNASAEELEGVQNEIECLKLTEHRNIVKLYDSFDDGSKVYIVMEYIGGETLYQKIIKQQTGFSEANVKSIIFSLASALEHCKENGIIHRDVKPKNIMYTRGDGGEVLKLIDFNMSCLCDPNVVEEIELDQMCGTAKYVAPEVANGEDYGYKVDIWSLGVVAYVCSSGGYLPFSSSATSSAEISCILDKVEDGKWLFEPKHAWVKVSDPLKHLISCMLNFDPILRLDYQGILEHEFMTSEDNFNYINIRDFHSNLKTSHTRLSKKKGFAKKLFEFSYASLF